MGSSYPRIGKLGLAALLLGFAPAGGAHGAGGFSPPGLYQPDVTRLENGLRVVLRPRAGARSVAIRLVVGVGSASYPCAEQETPHFLEHLLFSGTPEHTEEDLERRISSHGGRWNAATGSWETVYEVDIFSGHAAVGIETLHEILTRTELTDEKVEISRDVLLHEAGGEPGLAGRLLEAGFQPARARAYGGLMGARDPVCIPAPLATDVTRGEIEAAYRRFYVPENMSLIAVGDFELEAMRAAIRGSFGRMPARGTVAEPKPPVAPHPDAGTAFTGFADAPSVGAVFRTGGYLAPQHAALWVLETYLAQRLYQVLRVEHGLTYTPSVSYEPTTDVGLFWIEVTVDGEGADATRRLMDAEIERVRSGDLDREALEHARQGLLLSYAQGFESNADVADYYVASLFELDAYGRFVDEEAMLASLGADEILEAGAGVFAKDRRIALRDRRIFFEEIVAGAALVCLFAGAYAVARFAGRWKRWRGRV